MTDSILIQRAVAQRILDGYAHLLFPDDAAALRSALSAVPAGWVLVPLEPTEAMLDVGVEVYRPRTARAALYRAMIAAVSPPPAEPSSKGGDRDNRHSASETGTGPDTTLPGGDIAAGAPPFVVLDADAFDEAVSVLHPQNQTDVQPTDSIKQGAALLRELTLKPAAGAHAGLIARVYRLAHTGATAGWENPTKVADDVAAALHSADADLAEALKIIRRAQAYINQWGPDLPGDQAEATNSILTAMFALLDRIKAKGETK